MGPVGKKNGGVVPLDGALLNNHHLAGVINPLTDGIVIDGVGLFQVVQKILQLILLRDVAVGISGR